jgi:hypothetical protein
LQSAAGHAGLLTSEWSEWRYDSPADGTRVFKTKHNLRSAVGAPDAGGLATWQHTKKFVIGSQLQRDE